MERDIENGNRPEDSNVEKQHMYELETAQRESQDRKSRQVTFDEVVVVTPYRESSNSEDGPVIHSDYSAENQPPGYAYPRKRITCFADVNVNLEFTLLLLLISSLVVLFSGAYVCDQSPKCEGLTAFSIAAGAISFVGDTIVLVSFKRWEKVDEQIFGIVFVLMCLMWLISGIALTIPTNSPFLFPGTGFFATWGSFLFSLLALGSGGGELREIAYLLDKVDALTDRTRARQLILVVFFLLLVLASSASFCALSCTDYTIFSISWSSFCLVFAVWLLLTWRELGEMRYFWSTLTLSLILTVGSGIVSILGPFNGPGGTGLFASWFAVFFAWAAHLSADPRG